MVCMVLISCNSSTQKSGNTGILSEDTIKSSSKDSTTYLADIEIYKKQTEDSIATNDKRLQDFNRRIAKDKKARKEYKDEMDTLAQRSIDLKKKLDEYKADGKEKWATFKIGFNKDMNTLDKEFKDLISKDAKNSGIKDSSRANKILKP